MWNENLYIQYISPYLRNFRQKTNRLYNFSCPICGDSNIDKRKARGFLYEKQGNFFYRCHNCGASHSFSKFLELQFPQYYSSYITEKYRGSKTNEDSFSLDQSSEGDIDRSYKVSNYEKAMKYLDSRLIPKSRREDLFFIPSLSVLKPLFPSYNFEKIYDSPKIVIPIRDRSKKLIGATCRAISEKDSLRYVELKKDASAALIFGLDRVDFSNRILAFEGAFDSMFFKNAIAVNGSNLDSLDEHIPKNLTVLCFDNQPRNREICNLMGESIDHGWKILIWPEGIKAKDPNKMLTDRELSISQLHEVVKSNIFEGLEAKLRLAKWRKI